MALVAAPLSRHHTRAARAVLPLLLLATALLAAACGLGGEGGDAELALTIDQSDPDRPVLLPAPDPVEVDQTYFIRLAVPTPIDADTIRVRLEKRVGASFQQRAEFFQPVIPPWNVAVIPISVSDAGEWNVALIANSRKITDVTFTAERR